MTASPYLRGKSPVPGASTPGTPVASRPGGLLVVGDEGFTASVRQVLTDEGIAAPVATATDYLMALGEAATNPPAVVLGRIDQFDDLLDSSAHGLRMLLPHAQMLLVVSPSEEPMAVRAVRCGFNDYLIEPLDTQELARLVRGGLEAKAPATGDRGFRFPTMVVPPASDRKPAGAAGSVVGNLAQPPAHPSEPEPAAPALPAAAAPVATPIADAELGDVDLVAQIIKDPAGIGDLALRLIAARSGIKGLAWTKSEVSPAQAGESKRDQGSEIATANSGEEAAPVVYEGTLLGHLRAPAGTGSADLASWAAWLAHWMALDRTIKSLRDAAFHDDLTGVWNRRYFRQFLSTVLEQAARDRSCVTLMIFDIDDFKTYNDRYGHPAGDEILRQTARLMRSVVRAHDVVARIGGDEFAVVFWDAEEPRKPNSRHPHSVRRAAQRFQEAIRSHKFPQLESQDADNLTISGGLAGFPWDGRTPEELIAFADARALESKKQGKNALTYGPGAAGEEELPIA